MSPGQARAHHRSYEKIALPTAVFDLEMRLVYVNPAFEELVAWDCKPFIGRGPTFPFTALRADELDTLSRWGQLSRMGVAAVRHTYQTPQGRRIPVILTGGNWEDGGRPMGWVLSAHPDRGGSDGASTVAAVQITSLESQLGRLEARFDQFEKLLGQAVNMAPAEEPEALDQLSPREREVAGLLLEGYRVSNIARRLFISPHTVRNHVKSMLRKLEASSQMELVEIIRQGRPGSEGGSR